MKKIFNASQSRAIDKYTIEEEKISSIDLMERAAIALFDSIVELIKKDDKVIVFAGFGNNGGDALVLACLLIKADYSVEVYFIDPDNKISVDCSVNKNILHALVDIKTVVTIKDILPLHLHDVIIDGLFGIGLNRPVEGLFADVIDLINNSESEVYSIDIPSGMFVEDNTSNDLNAIVRASCVLTIGYPKLAMLMPYEQSYYNTFKIIDIGLSKDIINNTQTDYQFIEASDIKSKVKKRTTFSHKGTYGHALLITGSYGKMGAAILSSRACLHTGVGLLTVHVPKCGVEILQSVVPEAMVSIDRNNEYITDIDDLDLSKLTLGIGPAIGQNKETQNLLLELFESYDKPMVLDADALNIISSNDILKRKIPKNSILTPHPVEFDRLIGKKSENGYLRLQYARSFAKEYQVYLILKGAFSALISPDGRVCFNSTGNPGMSTGGSGDTLTGIVTSLLAQKYSSQDAMTIGAYLHGLSADLAIKDKSEESLLPTDMIAYIGKAYLCLK